MISYKGYEYLEKAMSGELESGTIIKTKHDSQYFDDFRSYDYYIYNNDNMFHRCNEKGKLGAKYQDRFLNYKVLMKDFEPHCVLEEKNIERIIELSDYQSTDMYAHKNKINEVIKKLNEIIDFIYDDTLKYDMYDCKIIENKNNEVFVRKVDE